MWGSYEDRHRRKHDSFGHQAQAHRQAGMIGYRKMTVALACIVASTVTVCMGRIDGAQYVGIMLGTAGAYLAAAYATAKKP